MGAKGEGKEPQRRALSALLGLLRLVTGAAAAARDAGLVPCLLQLLTPPAAVQQRALAGDILRVIGEQVEGGVLTSALVEQHGLVELLATWQESADPAEQHLAAVLLTCMCASPGALDAIDAPAKMDWVIDRLTAGGGCPPALQGAAVEALAALMRCEAVDGTAALARLQRTEPLKALLSEITRGGAVQAGVAVLSTLVDDPTHG